MQFLCQNDILWYYTLSIFPSGFGVQTCLLPELCVWPDPRQNQVHEGRCPWNTHESLSASVWYRVCAILSCFVLVRTPVLRCEEVQQRKLILIGLVWFMLCSCAVMNRQHFGIWGFLLSQLGFLSIWELGKWGEANSGLTHLHALWLLRCISRKQLTKAIT